MRTLEIMRIQRASYPSAGIPPTFSDNRAGRKECAGCRNGPGSNKRQGRDSHVCLCVWQRQCKEKRGREAPKLIKLIKLPKSKRTSSTQSLMHIM